MSHSDPRHEDHAPPAGYKLVAWQGVGVHVPQRWDIGRTSGDDRRGGFRIDNEYRTVIHVKWWRVRRQMTADAILREQAPLFRDDQRDGLREARNIVLPAMSGTVRAYESSAGETKREDLREAAVLWRDSDGRRVVLWRFLLQQEGPDPQTLQRMVDGLRLPAPGEPRQWALLEFRFQSPPGWQLRESSIAAGVCWFRLGRGRSRLTFRRFSAPDVARADSGASDALERFARRVYAGEFHDRAYVVDTPNLAGRRCALGMTSHRRRGALAWDGLLPTFRRSPHRIELAWDRAMNKVFAIELTGKGLDDGALLNLLDEMKVQPTCQGDASAPRVREEVLAPPQRSRLRALQARVLRSREVQTGSVGGNVTVGYMVERTTRQRLLRSLAAQPNEVTYTRTAELDPLGTLLWHACAEPVSVLDLVELVMQRLQISYREAELSVTAYVKQLGERGLVSLDMATE